MPPKSPPNLESTHRPLGRTSLTSLPLETDGSVSGPFSYVLIVASQVPSSAARTLCSGSGFWISWAVAVLARDHAARQARAKVRRRFTTLQAEIERDMDWPPCG